MAEVDMTVRKAKEMEIITHLRDERLWINTEMASTSVAKLNNLFKELDAMGEDIAATTTTIEPTDSQDSILSSLNNWIETSSPSEVNSSKKWKFGASQSHTGGTGVYATSNITKGEDVIVIPSEVMLSAKFGQGRHEDIAQLLNTMADNRYAPLSLSSLISDHHQYQYDDCTDRTASLMIFLLHYTYTYTYSVLELACALSYHKIQSTASFYHPYITSLPSRYTVPVYWDESVWEAIRDTRTIARALQTLRATASLYFRALNMVRIFKHTNFPYTKFSWQLFKWAMSTVITRQNQVTMTTRNPSTPSTPSQVTHEGSMPVDVMALIPGWDMMNHAWGKMTSYYDLGAGQLKYESMSDYAEGSEIHMCYGMRSSEMFMLYSGFCVSDVNPEEGIDVSIQIVRDNISRVRDLIVRNALKSIAEKERQDKQEEGASKESNGGGTGKEGTSSHSRTEVSEHRMSSAVEGKMNFRITQACAEGGEGVPKIAVIAALASCVTKAEAVHLMKTDLQNTSISSLLTMECMDCKTLEVAKRLITILLETTQKQLLSTLDKLNARLSLSEKEGKEEAGKGEDEGLEVVRYLITLFSCHLHIIAASLHSFTRLLESTTTTTTTTTAAATAAATTTATTATTSATTTATTTAGNAGNAGNDGDGNDGNGDGTTGTHTGSQEKAPSTPVPTLLTTALGTLFKCKASSVLNGSADFQVKNIFSADDSCWNSEGNGSGTSQYLFFDFLTTKVKVTTVRIMFQGGFVGQDSTLSIGPNKNNMTAVGTLESIKLIEDSNSMQEWEVPTEVSGDGGACFKIDFGSSTDFYGRVTIYQLQLLGERVE